MYKTYQYDTTKCAILKRLDQSETGLLIYSTVFLILRDFGTYHAYIITNL